MNVFRKRAVLTRWLVTLNAVAAAALAASPALGQLNAPPPATPEPKVRLDIDALLTSDQTTPDRVQGPVWQVTSQPGRFLLQIPMVVEPIDQDAELSRPPIDVKGGRFIAWRIPTADDRSYSGGGGGYEDFDGYYDDGGVGGFDAYSQPASRRQANAPAATETEGVRDDAPRMAREVIVHPDGTITWELDRSIPGGELTSTTADYALRLRPDLLQAQAPARPERSTFDEGGDPAANRLQQIEQQRQHREAMRSYRDLGSRIRDLPSEFTTPMPERLWAVFEVSQHLRELSLEGPDPLPWSMSLDAFRKMRELATRRSSGALTLEDFDRIAAMGAAVQNGHPLTRQLVARTITGSGMIQAMQPNDPLYGLMLALIRDGDAETRGVLLNELVNAQRTPGIDRLLAASTAFMDPEQKLAALRGALEEARSPEQLQEALSVVNRALADPHGADPGKLLAQLARSTQQMRSEDEMLGVLTTGTQFDLIAPDRLDQAIVGVMRAAVDSPLAGSWLNHRLLGSNDPQTVNATLKQLSEAKVVVPQEELDRRAQRASRNPRRPMNAYEEMDPYGGGYPEEFEEYYEEPDMRRSSSRRGPAGEPQAVRPETDEQGNVLLYGYIPLTTADHALIRLLESADGQQRQLAWASLPKFTLEDVRSSRSRGPEPAAQTKVQRILQAALSDQGKATPKQLPEFLDNLRDEEEGTAMLAATVIYASPDVAADAAKRLMGSHRNIGAAMDRMRPEERGVFGARMYEMVQGEAPDVVGVLRNPEQRSQVARWFGDQVAAGELPPPGSFAQQFQEQQLLTMAGSPSDELSRGAIAAMVSAVGGDKQDFEAVVNRFAQEGNRTPAALQKVWGPVKQEIYQRKMAGASGPYNVRVEVIGQAYDTGGYGEEYGEYGGGYGGPAQQPQDFGPGILGLPQTPSTPTTGGQTITTGDRTIIPLGVMNLEADAQGIRLANNAVSLGVPDSHLAIRIAQPNQLKNFEKPELSALPLTMVQEPLDLFPQESGAWDGQVTLDNGQTLRVVLEPAAGQ